MAEGKSFWSSLPGILTALAGLLTAGGALVAALHGAGLVGGDEQESVAHQGPTQAAAARLALRRAPSTLTGERLAAALIKHGLYEVSLNPAGSGVANRFETVVRNDEVMVKDAATGLSWQQGGTAGVAGTDAEAALAELNARGYAGHHDWRLPTAEEAASLLEPTAVDGRHVDPVFGSGVNFIWTADRTPDGKVYVAYWVDGRLSAERADFHAWLRAVR